MFHQIQIPIEDLDLMRFFWRKNENIENELQEFRMYVYLFGAVCSPSCANFALKQIANDSQDKFDSITIDTVKNCFYVDDCLTSAPSVSAAKLLFDDGRIKFFCLTYYIRLLST